ncbi:MAG: glycosyltransferase family 39 protein [Planctomycetota bacterium]
MRETTTHILIILTLGLIVFFVNLGQTPLWDRDEPRNAGCAAEMMQRGDLVVPIFNDQLRQQKPVLLYWLMMSAYSVFGVNEFSARFWSALLAIGTALATYAIGRRLFDATVGLVGAIALSTSLMFVVAGRAATPDSVLIFFGTLALMFYVLGVFPSKSSLEQPSASDHQWFFPTQFGYVVAIYISLGLGVLAKGPVGFLLPMAMIGLFGLIHLRKRIDLPLTGGVGDRVKHGLLSVWQVVHPLHFLQTLWKMRPLSATAIILAVAAPWFVLVHLRTDGDFTQLFFIGENLNRATVAMENHSGGWWFYPLAILLGFFPWSCFWGPTLIGLFGPLRNRERDQSLLAANTFLVCWVVVQVGAFSIASTKLPSYVTPCYPALALLTSSCLVTFCRSIAMKREGAAASISTVHRRWMYLAFGGLVFSGVMIIPGVWFGLTKFLPTHRWLGMIGLIPLLGGGWLWYQLYANRPRWIIPTCVTMSLLFVVGLFGWAAVSVGKQQSSRVVMDRIRDYDSAHVGTYGCLESTWIYYANKPIIELLVGDFSNPTSYRRPERKFWEPIYRARLLEFATRDDQPVLILTTDAHLKSLQQVLPEDFEVLESTPYFLKGQQIYLLGRAENIPDSSSGFRTATRESSLQTK